MSSTRTLTARFVQAEDGSGATIWFAPLTARVDGPAPGFLVFSGPGLGAASGPLPLGADLVRTLADLGDGDLRVAEGVPDRLPDCCVPARDVLGFLREARPDLFAPDL